MKRKKYEVIKQIGTIETNLLINELQFEITLPPQKITAFTYNAYGYAYEFAGIQICLANNHRAANVAKMKKATIYIEYTGKSSFDDQIVSILERLEKEGIIKFIGGSK